MTRRQTEAEGLLETGALYRKRLLLRPEAGDPVFAGFKTGAFSLYFGDAPIVHFDREGRWQRAYVAGVHYLKGLDTTVQTIDRVREGENLVLKRATAGFAAATDFDAFVRSTALDLISALDAGRLGRVEPPAEKAGSISNDELRAFLETVARWDAAAWFSHRETYLETYGPLPFLPPDCPSPVILQATLGHAGGRAFGNAPAAEHYVRSVAEFASHARAVAGLLGRRVDQCKAVFLGGGDVLRRPVDAVAAYLEMTARIFPIDPVAERPHPERLDDPPHRLSGVHAFLDQFAPPLPGPGDWRRLHALGLVRVSLGVESGDPSVRRLYGKTWEDESLRSTVSELKGAGVGVSLIVLVGAGGSENAGRGLDATADLVNSLELGPGDLVSLLDAREFHDSQARAETSVLTPLTGEAWAAQLDELRARLAPVRTLRKAKVVPYSLEKQGLA